VDGWNKVGNSGYRNSVYFDLQPPQSEKKSKKWGNLKKGQKLGLQLNSQKWEAKKVYRGKRDEKI